jgi:hypothetical protein
VVKQLVKQLMDELVILEVVTVVTALVTALMYHPHPASGTSTCPEVSRGMVGNIKYNTFIQIKYSPL